MHYRSIRPIHSRSPSCFGCEGPCRCRLIIARRVTEDRRPRAFALCRNALFGFRDVAGIIDKTGKLSGRNFVDLNPKTVDIQPQRWAFFRVDRVYAFDKTSGAKLNKGANLLGA